MPHAPWENLGIDLPSEGFVPASRRRSNGQYGRADDPPDGIVRVNGDPIIRPLDGLDSGPSVGLPAGIDALRCHAIIDLARRYCRPETLDERDVGDRQRRRIGDPQYARPINGGKPLNRRRQQSPGSQRGGPRQGFGDHHR